MPTNKWQLQMENKFIRQEEAQGAESRITAANFYAETGVNPTTFLDYVSTLTPRSKAKVGGFYELLRNGFPLDGVLEERIDKDNIPYMWGVIALPRGKQEFKVIMLSETMLDFFIKYQRAEVTIRFTLQELIDEAKRIENESSSNPTI
ncbi:hypothetical protein INP83_03085 [Mucilaginibacter sp. 21P]|uniref:hypothetical protein n=1 Tax=Mucilaginibacter sp. 21P TaxID=2778902 RepID=UPI001C580CA6|nr:hypothetical protein [Mucilaginibacter sp. 21P]QXV66094.1 hypothetical protein INP83_03085 [Mucilaginibacter sp. 21P]